MNQKRGIMEVLTGSILWGSIGVFVLVMARLGSTSALTGFLRMAFAFVILLIIALVHSGLSAFRLSKRALLAALLLGFLCQGLYNVFYNEAIMEIGMTMSAVLLNLAPLCTMLASHVLLGEPFSRRKWSAMGLCVFGCLLTVTGGNLSFAFLPVLGILYGLGSGATYGLTSVFGSFAGNCDVWVLSCYSYLFASIFLLFTTNPFAGVTLIPGLLTAGFLYALIPTALAYVIYYKGVQKIKENSIVPVVASMETVVAALFGVFLFREPLGVVNLAGMAVILLSIVLMNRKV